MSKKKTLRIRFTGKGLAVNRILQRLAAEAGFDLLAREPRAWNPGELDLATRLLNQAMLEYEKGVRQ